MTPWPTRIPKRYTKTVTFDGTAGNGAIGTVALGTVTGSILITHLTVRCKVDLVGAATLEMGVAGNTAALVAQIADATNIDVGEWWHSSSSLVGVAQAVLDRCLQANPILTIGTANITAGQLEIVMMWLPLSADGNIA